MGLKLGRGWNKGRFFGAALFLLLFMVGGWWDACPKVVAVVGETLLSEEDVSYRIAVQLAYGGTIEPPAALVALIKDAQEREVGGTVGVIVTAQEMDVFAKGVEKHSKAPEVLKSVKMVFAGDDDAYRRIYLMPKIINRKLRAWFSRDARVQKQPRDAIQEAYALAAAGNDFEQVAEATGLMFAKQDYKTEQKDAPGALKDYFPEGMAMLSPPFQKILDGLKAGKMAQTISEDNVDYRVVRLLKKGEGIYKTIEIIAVKEAFDPWFRKQVEKVPVRIQDNDLRAAIAAKYPNFLRNQSGEDAQVKVKRHI